MFAIKCPSCQHDNTPGEHFCAVCGVPLHLKPCPNCGVVDHVTAKVCSACGTTFPPIALAHSSATIDPVAPPNGVAAPRASNKVTVNRAWPLILVAVAAGGIPLLWMNRANMPLPKAWQFQSPSAAGSTVAPAPPTKLAPATPVAAPVPAQDPAATSADQTTAGRDTDGAVKPEPPPKKTAAAQARRPKAHAHPARPASSQEEAEPDAAAKEAAPRACTEAVAALGLCDPKQDRK